MLWLLVGTSTGFAQSTSFTYQGRLTDGGTAANGNYDLQFALFDSLSGGAQVGSTQTLNTVAVSNGVFTVSLDFGVNAFPGASRFLEISARPSGGGSFTLLSPRQQITSTPYAVRSLKASSADSVPASGVSAGSGNYIQNSTSPQTSSNFNISGNGTAGGTLSGNIVNATTQYNLNGSAILSASGDNLFAGTGAGAANTTGTENSFVGFVAGLHNTTGDNNTFVGSVAGRANTTGIQNSFFGDRAGLSNTKGSANSFFGLFAGGTNTDGNSDAFYGESSGASNTIGSNNAFFGTSAGASNTIGSNNAFFGTSAGIGNTSGNFNTLIGTFSNVLSGPMLVIDNATAIGARARVDASNSLVLGSINGVNGATASTKVGIGTTTPQRAMEIFGTGSDGSGNGDLLVTSFGAVGSAITLQANGARTYSWISTAGGADAGAGALAAFDVTGGAYRMVINSSGNVGIGTEAPDQRLSVSGNADKSSGGTTWAVFSDERLKNIKGSFTPGLKALLQLQPLRFQYKRDNALNLPSGNDEVGFSAQAVEKVLPEAVSRSNDGYLQLHSDPILWTMLNAIKEQQALIQAQQQQIAGLKKLVCRSRRRAGVCK